MILAAAAPKDIISRANMKAAVIMIITAIVTK